MTVSASVFAATNVPAGNVSGTWTKANSPYRINGDITVIAGAVLTIQPGVVVEFMGQYRMTISGKLNAIGLAADQIKFTKTNITNLGLKNTVNGGWRGISFYHSADTSRMSNCIVEYANSYENIYYYWEKAPVDCQYSSVIISDCTIRNNYGAISGGIRIDYGYFEVTNNLITNNESFTYAGGISVFTNGKKYIRNNRIISNKGMDGGGIYVWRGGLQIIIESNFISQNIASSGGGGIHSTVDAGAQVNQNIIVNNEASWGGGLYYESSGKVLIGNTICNNLATGSGGGIYFSQPNLMDAENNILWNNKAGAVVNQNVYVTANSFPVFKNNLIGGGAGNITPNGSNVSLENSLDANPQFKNPTAGQGKTYASIPDDWTILSSSPCINTGTTETYADKISTIDFISKPRIKFGIIDMGAFEYAVNTISVAGTYNTPVKWFADTVKVTNNVSFTQPLQIAPGVLVQFQGYYSIISANTYISAIGTKESPIRFEIKDTTGFSNDSITTGKWNSISLSYSNTSVFKYCNFSKGEKVNTFQCNGLIVENCNFSNFMSQYGVFQAYGDYTSVKDITITDCLLTFDATWLTYGISLTGLNVLLHNAKIFNNEQQGVYINGTNVTVQNSLIANNAGGIHASEGDIHKFYNNTVVYNQNWGFNKSANTGVIANNIIYGNANDISTLPYVDELFIYNNIIQSERPARSYEKLSGNIIANPGFINPVAVQGRSAAAKFANYELTTISPAIDKGLTSVISYSVPTLDILSNSRPNHGLVDIGAYENQGSIPSIVTHPSAGNLCEGTDLSIQVLLSNTDSVYLQWKKDGVVIPGKTSSKLELKNLTVDMIASYTCSVSNAYGTVETYPANLSVKAKPQILSISDNQEICEAKDLSVEVSAAGNLPLSYSWEKNGDLLADVISSRYKILNAETAASGNYVVTVSNQCGSAVSESVSIVINPAPQVDLGTDQVLCANNGVLLDPGLYQSYLWSDFTSNRYKTVDISGDYSVKVVDEKGCVGYSDTVAMVVKSPFEYEEICMVMTDPESEKNMIIWEKTPEVGTNRYQVWKTSGANYTLVSETMEADGSSVVDWSSKPRSKTDAYVLVSIDTCGNVSQKSSWHKPFLLQSSRGLGDNTINLSWEPYLVDGMEYIFKSIVIYRGSDSTKLEAIDTISAGIGSVSYTDENPPLDVNLFYRIGGEKDQACDPNNILGKKASNGPYVHSLSNLEDNRLQSTVGISTKAYEKISCFPNPFVSETKLRWHNTNNSEYDLKLFDARGSLIKHEKDIRGSEYTLSRENLSKGVYFVEIHGEKLYKSKLIVE